MNKTTDTLDMIYPSNNDWGIPNLLLEYQARSLPLPFYPYRKVAASRHTGTMHFYVDDDRFSTILIHPDKLKSFTDVAVLVEPNITVSLESPLAWVIYSTYQKRWLARYWQSIGFSIFVDVNVPAGLSEYVLAGVPKGWRSYCTRGYAMSIDALLAEAEMCHTHAGTKEIFFVVYGGGGKVRELCQLNSWLWMPDETDRSRGRYHE